MFLSLKKIKHTTKLDKTNLTKWTHSTYEQNAGYGWMGSLAAGGFAGAKDIGAVHTDFSGRQDGKPTEFAGMDNVNNERGCSWKNCTKKK